MAKAVADRREAWRKNFGTEAPEDMAYASASGLDPDIGVDSALAQVEGVAVARALGSAQKAALEGEIRQEAERSTTPLGPP